MRQIHGTATNNVLPPEVEVRALLEQILSTPELQNNERRSALLRYIVEEKLAGRSDRIKGRNIAIDVFNRKENFDSQRDPIVRQEARRLRHDLDHYFLNAGRDDLIRIDIPKGGYVPAIEWADPSISSQTSPTTANRLANENRRRNQITAAFLTLFLLGVFGTWFLFPSEIGRKVGYQQYEKNSEAFSLFRESIQISRPPSFEARVLAALDLARETTKHYPNFSGGYAAESYLLWLSIVFGHSRSREEDSKRALALAEKAIQIDPEFAWGYQSLSQARHMLDDLDGAVVAARDAVDILPEDAELRGNLGLILLLAGRPADAIEPLQAAIQSAGENVRIPYRNYLVMAYFHNGNFQESIAMLETNRRLGGPMGPHMYAYLAAAHAKVGNMGRAHAAAGFVRTKSDKLFVKVFIESLFHDAETRQLTFSALKMAGLDIKNL